MSLKRAGTLCNKELLNGGGRTGRGKFVGESTVSLQIRAKVERPKQRKLGKEKRGKEVA